MRVPVSVFVTIVVHALWLPGALIGVALYTAPLQPADAGSAAFAACCSVTALYGLVRRRRWGRFFSAWYLGSIAVFGWIVLLLLAFQGQSLVHAWPGFVFFPLFSWLALALMLGNSERRYFAKAKSDPGVSGTATYPPQADSVQPAVAADVAARAFVLRSVGFYAALCSLRASWQRGAAAEPRHLVTIGGGMVKTYRVGRAAYRPFQRRFLLSALFFLPPLTCVALLVASRVGGPLFDATSLAITVVMMAGSAAVVVFRGLRWQRESFLASEWLLSEASISRRTPHYSEIEIRAAEIRRIEESRTELVVRGATRRDAISIPKGLDGFEEVRAELMSWHEFSPAVPIGLLWTYSLLLGVGFWLSLWLTFTSSNIWLLVPFGVVQVAAAIWGFWKFRTSRLVDSRVKWAAWAILLPGVLVLIRAWLALRG